MFRRLMNDETGFIVSAELVLIFTLAFCGVAVGMSVVRDALVQELGDVAEAIGALNQSYSWRPVVAFPVPPIVGFLHSSSNGSGFFDQADDCDCDAIEFAAIIPKSDPNNADTGTGSGDGS